MPARFQALPEFLDRLADGAPPRIGFLLMCWLGDRQVGKRCASFRQNVPISRCGDGTNPAGSDIDTENDGRT